MKLFSKYFKDTRECLMIKTHKIISHTFSTTLAFFTTALISDFGFTIPSDKDVNGGERNRLTILPDWMGMANLPRNLRRGR